MATDFTIDVSGVIVLDSITSNQPGMVINIDFNLQKNINLADKEFYYPKEIGLLLGADIVAQALQVTFH